MNLIKGKTIRLYEKVKVGEDAFNAPIYEEIVSDVDNVLISPTTNEDIVNEMQIYGKHSVYTLSIPKKDTHSWEDCEVLIFGKRYKQFGAVTEYMEELTPGAWNKQVKVELYE